MKRLWRCRLALKLPSLALFIGALIFGGNAVASEQKTFRFNVSPSGYPPYLILENSQPSGIMWDVVARISERLGYELVAKRVPRKRVDQMLLDGFIDGTPPRHRMDRCPGPVPVHKLGGGH